MHNYKRTLIYTTFKKYYDFVELATEAITEYTKQEKDKAVPKWNREEVEEIVIAQVLNFLVSF